MNPLLDYAVLNAIIQSLPSRKESAEKESAKKESLFKRFKKRISKIFNPEVKLPPYIMSPEEYTYYKHLYYRRGTRLLTVKETVR